MQTNRRYLMVLESKDKAELSLMTSQNIDDYFFFTKYH